jgi:hypothetical protein
MNAADRLALNLERGKGFFSIKSEDSFNHHLKCLYRAVEAAKKDLGHDVIPQKKARQFMAHVFYNQPSHRNIANLSIKST